MSLQDSPAMGRLLQDLGVASSSELFNSTKGTWTADLTTHGTILPTLEEEKEATRTPIEAVNYGLWRALNDFDRAENSYKIHLDATKKEIERQLDFIGRGVHTDHSWIATYSKKAGEAQAEIKKALDSYHLLKDLRALLLKEKQSV